MLPNQKKKKIFFLKRFFVAFFTFICRLKKIGSQSENLKKYFLVMFFFEHFLRCSPTTYRKSKKLPSLHFKKTLLTYHNCTQCIL